MNFKNYQKIRILIALLIASIVVTATIINNFYLAISGILIGTLFLFLAKSKFKEVVVDERVISMSGKAARATYSITTLFFAMLGLFFIFTARTHEDIYSESLGVVFCYVALLSITIYSISFHFFNKKYGANEE